MAAPDGFAPRLSCASEAAMNDVSAIERPDPAAALAEVSRGLSIVSIAKSYDKKAVLLDVSLGVERGEVVGLLGPNGAGKTTCFYSVMGLVKPDSGRILLDGQDITRLPMYRRAILGLGYLPQETSIFRGLTVAQNIMAVLEVAEPKRRVREARLEQLLGEFHIEHLRDASAWPCRRRAAAVRDRAGAGRGSDDHAARRAFRRHRSHFHLRYRELVRQLKQRDIGVLITDHNVRETARHRRSRLHHLRRRGAVAGSPHRPCRRRECPPPLSGRELRAVGHGAGSSPRSSGRASRW
jgi:lipopolysaccharide export system ATP-binding protein